MKNFHNNYIPFTVLLLTLSWPLQADLLQSSTITAINTEYNNTSWAASNLRDDDPATRWLSSSANPTNDINFQFNANGDTYCFDSIDLINYGTNDISVKQFMLLSSSDIGLNGDTSTNAIGWKPVVADDAPSGLINYLSWAQGGRLASIDSQYNTTSWAAKNSHDGSPFSRWLSKSYQANNTLEFNFDTDWDGNTGNSIPIEEIEITNYGNDDRSIKELQIEVTTDGTTWFKLEVPGTLAGDSEYVFTQRQEGGVLGNVDSQYNTSTTWAATNIQDGNQLSRWLSKSYQGNNTIEFTFDPDNDGQTGANGDVDDLLTIDKFYLENYGTDDRSIREFQVAVKTLFNPNWSKVTVPGAAIGAPGYDFLLSHHGAELVTIDSEYNNALWGADNIHDGDHMTRWLSKNTQSNNVFEFQFDVNEDGIKNVDDHFTINSFFLQNYGDDDRSIREFQVSVKTASNSSWQKIKVSGATIGTADYNFLLKDQGGFLAAVDSQYNTTSWAAKNIHDGSQMTRWLSKNKQSNNTLEFTFDVDEDGNTGTASDLFIMESFYLENYGVDDRSIREFQVAVKTLSEPTWKKIKVPGSTIGIADHNFLLADHGGILTAVDSQYNTTSWAAKNIHDGSQMTRWLSLNTQLNNTLDFQFDVNEDGTTGGIDDLFTMESFYLQNYGDDDRSIKEFQVEVKTSSNTNWTKVQVPGTAANQLGYNFSLAANGGALTLIDDQYNTTSLAAKNIHDGSQISRWLSPYNQIINTLEFAFDTDSNGNTGDPINVNTIELINYGDDDRSIQTFEVDIKVSGAWQPVNAPGGGTIFTADMNSIGQSWSIAPQTNVTATRFRTLSNYGDANYIGAREVTFSGVSIGPSHTFTAAMNGSGETFALVAPILDITDVRLRTISNHGDPNYVGATEFKVQGISTISSSTFVAAMDGNGETFTLSTPLVDVTDVKLMTISNHGDPNYVGAAEFKVLGPSITKTATFVAAMHGNGETFVLDSDDIPVDVTDVKLTTISNHGDPNYVGAKDFKVLGNSITETKTFVAAMHGDGESFILDSDDVPLNVTDVKLITINNHGDSYYVGAKEFEVIGHSVTPAHTFVLPMQAEPYRIALDNDDTVTGVVGARIITIRNHGDPNYIGAADFQLLGTAIGPSYVFEAEMDSSTQHFAFSPLNSNLLRFHTLNNHGDPTYTGASELVLNSGLCPTGQWHMDEESWSGTAGEVIDSSGGEHSGTVFGIGTGLADPDTANTTPAIIGNPGTCSYGEFDGIDDYIEIPDSEDFDNTSQITLSAWFNAKSFSQTNGTNARGLFSKRPSFSNDISYGAFFWNNHGNNLYIDIDGGNDRFASNTSFDTDTWYHIAIVYDGTQIASQRVRLYVNGVLDGTFTESSSSIPDTDSNFYIGNLYTGLSQLKVFDGAIDEVNVIPEALTEAKVLALKNATQPCNSLAIHHYEIEHDGQGLTCDTESITIKACIDESCENLSNEPITLDFQVTNDTTTKTESSPTFTGSKSINFNHTLTETLTLSIANPTIAPTNLTICKDGASDSCEIKFDDALLEFSTINDQISGLTFNGINIQALKDVGGVCTPLFSGSKNIEIAMEYHTPDETTNNIYTISANDIEKNANGVVDNYTEVPLNFLAHSTANLGNNQYNDAGEIKLHARYTVPATSDDPSFTIEGESNAFWVSPDKLVITSSNTDKTAAGEDFILTVTAYNSLGTELENITTNYQPGELQLKLQRTAPLLEDISAEGELTYSATSTLLSAISPALGFQPVTLSNFSSGISTYSEAKYTEVGTINLNVQDINYGDNSPDIHGVAADLGPFTPHHFTQRVLQHGSFLNSCNMDSTYAYSGQKNEADTNLGAIQYLTNPIIEIIARNKAGDITKNYYHDFMMLKASDIEFTAPTQDQDAKGVDGTPLLLTANISSVEGTLSNTNLNAEDEENVGKSLPYGTLHYELSDDDHFFYQRSANTLVIPFLADIDFSIAATTKDSDKVSIKSDSISPISPIGLEIRFARMLLKNSFGPETSNLPQPLQIEHYNDDKNFVFTDDNCASYDITNISLDPTSPSNVLIPTDTEVLAELDINPGTFSAGKTNAIMLKAPGAGKQGALKVTYETFNWLKYDWDAGGTHDDNPTATATFGRFRGNDRIIYWREVNN